MCKLAEMIFILVLFEQISYIVCDPFYSNLFGAPRNSYSFLSSVRGQNVMSKK